MREHSGLFPAEPLHRLFRKASFDQFHKRVDFAGAITTYRCPLRLRNGGDFHRNFIQAGSADESIDHSRGYLQIDDTAAADISASARQAVRVVAVAFQILAPRLSPERLRNP